MICWRGLPERKPTRRRNRAPHPRTTLYRGEHGTAMRPAGCTSRHIDIHQNLKYTTAELRACTLYRRVFALTGRCSFATEDSLNWLHYTSGCFGSEHRSVQQEEKSQDDIFQHGVLKVKYCPCSKCRTCTDCRLRQTWQKRPQGIQDHSRMHVVWL